MGSGKEPGFWGAVLSCGTLGLIPLDYIFSCHFPKEEIDGFEKEVFELQHFAIWFGEMITTAKFYFLAILELV